MKGQNAKPIPSELYNASLGGYVTSSEQVKDYKIGLSQEDVNQFLLHRRTRHVTVAATPETTSVEQVLPAVGDEDTIYRVGSWDGNANAYNPNKHSEYGWNSTGDNIGYILLSVEDYGIDDEPTPGSSNTVTSGGVAAVEGYYDEDPEYLRVYLDGEGRLIKGIKKDGTQYFAIGLKTDASYTSAIENPEFLKVYLDGQDRILWAITRTGDIYYGAGVPTQIVLYIEEALKPFKEQFYYVSNPEFIELKIDNLNRILEGYRVNGSKYYATAVENDSAEVSTDINPEFLQLLLDAGQHIVNSIDRKLENIRYGGISITELKRDLDASVLEVYLSEDTDDIYTIENNDSTISMEIDDDWNVYEVKDSSNPYELDMNAEGEVFIEETINEI